MTYNSKMLLQKEGIVHVHCSYNNTIVTATKDNGDTISWSSGGTKDVKGSRRSSTFSAQSAATRVGESIKAQGITKITVFLKGMGNGRSSVPKGLQIAGLKIISITDKTVVAYNGCRPSKKRRI